MRIKDLPQEERPRERLIRCGAHALSETELLAILLRHGTRACSAIEMAQLLLQKFGSLRNVVNAPFQEFSTLKGLGCSHYVQLQAAWALSQRLLEKALPPKISFDNLTSLEQFLLSKLGIQTREVFSVLFLNAKFELMAYEELFFGTVNSATVHPREVIKRVLAHNAAAIILAHNHPSGDPTPSEEDKRLTEVLQDSLKWLEVKVLQHMVVGHHRCESVFL